jgi:hypothetical protein
MSERQGLAENTIRTDLGNSANQTPEFAQPGITQLGADLNALLMDDRFLPQTRDLVLYMQLASFQFCNPKIIYRGVG